MLSWLNSESYDVSPNQAIMGLETVRYVWNIIVSPKTWIFRYRRRLYFSLLIEDSSSNPRLTAFT